MPPKRREHHITHNPNGGWDVKRNGADRASIHTENKQDAVDIGRRISQNQRTELIIHNLDGHISQSDSHGKDPNPPKDKN